MNNLTKFAEKALAERITEIKSAPKGSKIVESNQHLFEANSSTWAGGGELTVEGLYWWKADCDLALSDFSTGVKVVSFSATGTGAMLGVIASEVVGAFVVDPKTINGDCHFTIVTAAAEEGMCTLTLYSTSGTLYGTFVGPGEGLAAGTMSGTGTLTSY